MGRGGGGGEGEGELFLNYFNLLDICRNFKVI